MNGLRVSSARQIAPGPPSESGSGGSGLRCPEYENRTAAGKPRRTPPTKGKHQGTPGLQRLRGVLQVAFLSYGCHSNGSHGRETANQSLPSALWDDSVGFSNDLLQICIRAGPDWANSTYAILIAAPIW